METIILIITIGLINAFCFILGAKVGQRVQMGKEIEMPRIEPINAIREHNENKEQRKEQERLRVIAENIDNYNGTGIGQQEVPR